MRARRSEASAAARAAVFAVIPSRAAAPRRVTRTAPPSTSRLTSPVAARVETPAIWPIARDESGESDAAIAAYTAALHVNANNHALDGGPETSAMEVEVMAWLAEMFGFPEQSLGHLTSSGTIANLEALWVAGQLHPERAIVHGAIIGRSCHVGRDTVLKGRSLIGDKSQLTDFTSIGS